MPVSAPGFQFDVDKLLAPIAPADAAGASLRYDPVYDHIQELRREDDSSLPQGVWKTDLKRADWASVETACLDLLESRSKDLQVAAWLLEAWLHLHGFVGVAEGFRAMHALADVFWDDLHPRIQNGDTDFRIAPVLWLNDKLPPLLKTLPLTAPDSSDVPLCTLAAWEKASQNTHLKPDARVRDPGPTLAALQQSAMLTSTPFLLGKLAEVSEVLTHCVEFDKLLDQKLGREAPGLMPVRSVAEEAAALLHALLRDRGLTTAEPFEPDEYLPEHEAEGSVYLEGNGHIGSRAEAYQMLADAADYLARTEPHSPTPHLVRRAIAWGAMSLDQLLPELVRNPAELSDIYRLLDLAPPNNLKR